MICKGCGAEITSDQVYCPRCGTRNEMVNKPYPPVSPKLPSVPLLPPIPPNPPDPNKRKNTIILALCVGAAILCVISLGVFSIVAFIGYMVDDKPDAEKVSEAYVNESMEEAAEGESEAADSVNEAEADSSKDTSGDTSDAATKDSSEEESTTDTTDTSLDSSSEDLGGLAYNLVYSYTEAPDVISIDSDLRFVYYNYYYDTDVVTYIYQFNDNSSSEEDFYKAVDDYTALLIDLDSFYYEEDFSKDQYNETGVLVSYFSKDDTAIGVETKTDDTGRYAYISIYDLSGMEEASGTAQEDKADDAYSNYTYYVEGRETQYFDLSTEIILDNGLAYYLNSATVTDLGDGTAQIDCNINLAAKLEGTCLYTDDFVIIPMDNEGYMLEDAGLMEYIIDESGQYVTAPYLMDIDTYHNFTITFIVPSDTTSFNIYATNLMNGYSSGDLYYTNLVAGE